MPKECGFRISNTLGVVEEVEVDEDDVGWGSFLRLKILLDLKTPLARGRIVMISDKKFWVPIKYERFPKVCFQCGHILHES